MGVDVTLEVAIEVSRLEREAINAIAALMAAEQLGEAFEEEQE